MTARSLEGTGRDANLGTTQNGQSYRRPGAGDHMNV